jgi:hypothetical protein
MRGTSAEPRSPPDVVVFARTALDARGTSADAWSLRWGSQSVSNLLLRNQEAGCVWSVRLCSSTSSSPRS